MLKPNNACFSLFLFLFIFYHFSNNDDVVLISVESPSMTPPTTSNLTGILRLNYDLSN